MTRLRLSITMSVDGYVAGPNQSVTHPLGEGGEELHKLAFSARTFRELHGLEGGTIGPDDTIAAESGSVTIGREPLAVLSVEVRSSSFTYVRTSSAPGRKRPKRIRRRERRWPEGMRASKKRESFPVCINL